MSDTRIVITADSAGAESALRRLGEGAQGLGRRFADLTGLASGLAGALSVGAFATFVQNTINGIDALNDLSDATGASIENLSALEDIAVRTGTSFDTVGTALVKFNQQLNEARPGSQMELNLKAIGLSADELRKMDPAEALRTTAIALSSFADDGNKARLVQELFGKSVREVAPLLKDLAAGGQLVAKVTKEQAEQAEAFNKQLAELKKNATDASRALVSDLVTGLNAAAKAFREGGFVAGLQTLLTGDDQYKNNKAIVENTDKLWRLENSLLAARAEGYKETSKYVQNIKAQIEQTKAALGTNINYARVLEGGPTGEAPAPPAANQSINAARAEDLKRAAEEREKARKAAEEERKKGIEAQFKSESEYLLAVTKNVEEREAVVREAALRERALQKEAEESWQRSTAQRLAQIQTQNMSEQELQRGYLATIQADLEAARIAGFITEQQYNELIYQETIKHQARLGNAEAQGIQARMKFERMTSQQKTQFMLNQMVQMTAGVATQSRALFNINKIAAISEAAVMLPAGVSKTFNSYPYPWNIPMAALHLVSGLAHIQQIKSAQFGSSTSAPSIAGGAAVPVFDATSVGVPGASLQEPAASVPRARQQINLNFQGSGKYTYDEVVNGILPLINEAGDNGADINIFRG